MGKSFVAKQHCIFLNMLNDKY